MKQGILNKLEYAIYFATKAHNGQKRKTEKDVDMIFHPYTVAMMLEKAGVEEECVIAGLLHDVVEDTKYTLEDIENIFGKNIMEIISVASENKQLDWENRKNESIKKVETANHNAKMLVCADKVNNLETLYNSYMEQGEAIWESFNRGKEQQKWYYTKMYEAVIKNEENNELYNRYKNILEKIFN